MKKPKIRIYSRGGNLVMIFFLVSGECPSSFYKTGGVSHNKKHKKWHIIKPIRNLDFGN